MKKFLMRFSCFVLALLTCFAFTACGGNKKDSSDDDEQPDGRRILKVEVLKGGIGETPYREIAKAFMKEHPDVLVKLNFNVNIISTTGARLESNNNVADVYSYRSIEAIKRWKIQGWVENIDDIYDATLSTGKTVSQTMTGNAEAVCTYKDEHVAIPEYTNTQGFVYNMSLFEKYGWKVPTTTKELEDLCKQILKDTNKTVAPIVYCGAAADGYLYYGEENWNYQYSGIADLDNFYSFSDAEVFNPAKSQGKLLGLQALKKFFFDNVGTYTMAGSEGKDHIEAQTNLILGEAAMMLNGSWFMTENEKILAEVPDTKIGMFPVPQLSDESGNVLHSDTYETVDNKRVVRGEYVSYWFVPSMAANKSDAKEFLKFLSEPSSCEIYTNASNNIRPFEYEKNPDAAVYKDMTTFGKSVLKINAENYIYAPNITSDIAIKGLTGYWARGSWPYYDVRDKVFTPEQIIQNDYDYAKKNWSKFLGMV